MVLFPSHSFLSSPPSPISYQNRAALSTWHRIHQWAGKREERERQRKKGKKGEKEEKERETAPLPSGGGGPAAVLEGEGGAVRAVDLRLDVSRDHALARNHLGGSGMGERRERERERKREKER